MSGPPILVTGATGSIGWNIAQQLARTGGVRALVRDREHAAEVLPSAVELVTGDLNDPPSIRRALEGVRVVFHAAGMPEQWVRNPALFHRVNVEGTRALTEAARAEGVEAFVYTSTVDVFRRSPAEPFDESVLETEPLGTPYERSKQGADRIVAEAMEAGLPARFVHPAAFFGPSPSATPGVNALLVKLARNRMPALPPGGMPVVYGPDLGRGHILAAEAPVGSRYILSDRYVELAELAALVQELLPKARRPPVLSEPIARFASKLTEGLSNLTWRPPLLPAGQLHFLLSQVTPDASRARRELGWRPTPFRTAIAKTLSFLGEMAASEIELA